ncbi:DUF4249 domain-containing protein [Flavobacteriales bacterium]|nr:DUF4249 domain-containing protein [Flavobacteriales bacterium]
MKKINIIIVIIGSLLFLNCRPEPIDIDLPQAEKKLVISSQVIPGSIMLVTVSRSMDTKGFNIDEDSISQDILNQLLVDSGIVTISYNGISDTLFSAPGIPGVFLSISTPQILNTTYNLYAKDYNTGMEVTSSAFMLPQVSLNSASASIDTSGVFDITNVNYEFTDPQGEDNWYMVNFYAQKDSNSSGGGFDLNENESVLKETIILKDKDFSSSIYSGSHQLSDWNQDSIAVSISNISKGYYDYLTARLRSGGLFASISREPVNHPTNIIGGYGFFTTHKPSIIIVPVN